MSLLKKMKMIFLNEKFIFILYLLLSLFATIQSSRGKKEFSGQEKVYTHYNNYVIFSKSFDHLKEGKELYVAYPDEYWDLYKYTPTFSVFFGLFNLFPEKIGLFFWNLFNALIVLLAIRFLPRLSNLEKGVLMLILAVELMTSIQNEQSNGMVAGLLALALGLAERNKLIWATFVVVCSAYVKLFGVVGFAIFLLYPNKVKVALYSAMWTVILFFLPLLYTDFQGLLDYYKAYGVMLKQDFDDSYGLSVMGWLHSWFQLVFNKNTIVLIGVVVFLIPLYKFKLYTNEKFKLLLLASILIWIVIFNHKAESPTFIIAMLGVGIWFLISPKNRLNWSLFLFAILFTSLSPTDLFPKSVRMDFVKPYVMKAVPCIFIWFKIIYDMIQMKSDEIKKVNEAV